MTASVPANTLKEIASTPYDALNWAGEMHATKSTMANAQLLAELQTHGRLLRQVEASLRSLTEGQNMVKKDLFHARKDIQGLARGMQSNNNNSHNHSHHNGHAGIHISERAYGLAAYHNRSDASQFSKGVVTSVGATGAVAFHHRSVERPSTPVGHRSGRGGRDQQQHTPGDWDGGTTMLVPPGGGPALSRAQHQMQLVVASSDGAYSAEGHAGSSRLKMLSVRSNQSPGPPVSIGRMESGERSRVSLTEGSPPPAPSGRVESGETQISRSRMSVSEGQRWNRVDDREAIMDDEPSKQTLQADDPFESSCPVSPKGGGQPADYQPRDEGWFHLGSMRHEDEAFSPTELFFLPDGWPEERPMTAGLAAAVPIATTRATRSSANLDGYRSSSASGMRSLLSMDKWICVLEPSSTTRSAFDLVSILALAYDMIVIPFIISWGEDILPQDGAIQYFVNGYWTLDIMLNFVTGFYEKDAFVTDYARIAKHYFKTSFTLDFFLTIIGWATLLLSFTATMKNLKLVRMTKLTRLLRLASVMRLMKVTRLLEDLVDRVASGSGRFVLSFVTVAVSMLWFAHFVCCIWFTIGNDGVSDTGDNWLRMNHQQMELKETSISYQYFTSYHWAMAQLTLGGADAGPTNTLERIYSIICLLLGLLLNCSLVSFLSSVILDVVLKRQEQEQRLEVLRTFLSQAKVEAAISIRVERQVNSRMKQRRELTPSQVPALQMLSSSLLSELQYAVFKPKVTGHPLFLLWSIMDGQSMHRFCDKAVTMLSLMPEDQLFFPGDDATCAYCLAKGSLIYSQSPETSMVAAFEEFDVVVGDWFCESALWCQWIHVGTMEARTQCQVVSVSQTAVFQVLSGKAQVQELVTEYGRQYYARVISAKPPLAAWPSDIAVPFADFGHILQSMQVPFQVLIGLLSLDMSATPFRFPRQYAKLNDEIRSGESLVMFEPLKQVVVRVVSVVVVRIESPAGAVLMQLAKKVGPRSGGAGGAGGGPGGGGESLTSATSGTSNSRMTLQITGKLPGGKQRRSEAANDAMNRILEAELRPLASRIQKSIALHSISSYDKDSDRFDLQTHYLRTVFSVKFPTRDPIHGVNLHERPVYCYQDRLFSWVTANELDQFEADPGEKSRILSQWSSRMQAAPPECISELSDLMEQVDDVKNDFSVAPHYL